MRIRKAEEKDAKAIAGMVAEIARFEGKINITFRALDKRHTKEF